MFARSKHTVSSLSSLGKFCVIALAAFSLLSTACSKKSEEQIPDNFKQMSTEAKMKYLMDSMPPDSVALFICNSAMGRIYNSRIELQEAMAYAYGHYGEDDQIAFDLACAEFEKSLSLEEKVKFTKLAAIYDPEMYSYELGLSYVGEIREGGKDVKKVKEELDKLKVECKSDPQFYKRFMKGFKLALNYDRGRDLDDKIYTQFISYPDSI